MSLALDYCDARLQCLGLLPCHNLNPTSATINLTRGHAEPCLSNMGSRVLLVLPPASPRHPITEAYLQRMTGLNTNLPGCLSLRLSAIHPHNNVVFTIRPSI